MRVQLLPTQKEHFPDSEKIPMDMLQEEFFVSAIAGSAY